MVGSNIGTEEMEISSGPTFFVAADSAKQLTCADARVESHQTVNSHLLRLPCHLAQTFSAWSLKWNMHIIHWHGTTNDMFIMHTSKQSCKGVVNISCAKMQYHLQSLRWLKWVRLHMQTLLKSGTTNVIAYKHCKLNNLAGNNSRCDVHLHM